MPVPSLSGDVRWNELVRHAPPARPVVAELASMLSTAVSSRITPGSRIGIAVGSRGIADIAEVATVVCAAVRSAGATPVLIPAMGSHGGGTPEGQLKVLAELGIDPKAVGADVEASVDVRPVGKLASGRPVYVARAALECDAVVPIARVKPHTDFHARIESGLAKMLSIGLGKPIGAASLHAEGFRAFHAVLPAAAQQILGALRVAFGVALIEDGWHRLFRCEIVDADAMLAREEELLREARPLLARLPFHDLDVLVLREIGKTISGAGMDPNVTGRFVDAAIRTDIDVQRLVVLDLRADSAGNAIGLGLADIVTERLRSKIDWATTYANAQASRSLAGAKLPFVARTDQDAIEASLDSLIRDLDQPPRVVAMANTADISHIAVSSALTAEAIAGGYELCDETTYAADFTARGDLRAIGGLRFFGEDGEVAVGRA